MGTCAEPDCDEPAAVRLHVPWTDDRDVCTDHVRSLAQQDGVVAGRLRGAEEDGR
jgi:hypothetical protein